MPKYTAQKLRGAKQLDAGEIDFAEIVSPAFFDGQSNILGAADVIFLDQRNVESGRERPPVARNFVVWSRTLACA